MNPETTLMHRIMFAASRGNIRLFRQNVGMAWAGRVEKFPAPRTVHVTPSDVVIRNARPFHAGIEGMSDLGGWKTITVTQDMIGRRIAVYVAAEVKVPKKHATPEQQGFIDAVLNAGGIAGVVRSEDDAMRLLGTGTAGTAGAPRAASTDG
jgi:hypothetical protein